MDKIQEAINSMGHKTIDEMYRHHDAWKDNPVIVKNVGKIEGLFEKIDTNLARQNRKTQGATGTKAEYRENLNISTDIFMGIFRSYANDIGDKEIYTEFDMTITIIREKKDTEFPVLVNTVEEFATKNKDKLKDHGFEDKMLEQYGKDKQGYISYLTKPQDLVAERKTATNNLKELFPELEKTFTESLDNNMNQFRLKDKEFYDDYMNARNIYNNPTIARSLLGNIKTEDTKVAIPKVKITARLKDGTEKIEFVKFSTAKGNYMFKNLPDGIYDIIFEKHNYDTLIIEKEIRKGLQGRLNVELRPTE